MSDAEVAGAIRVTGTVAALEIMDVSKRAGVELLKSYLTLDVVRVEPAAAGDPIGGRCDFVTDGELQLVVGAWVEVATVRIATPIGPRPIYGLVELRPEMG